jgi:cell filamentation protein
MADIYTYPGTDVLINKADIRDETKLRELEYAKTTRRAADAPTFPLSTAGYKDLHKHLFDEVYDWAGKTRTINFTKLRLGLCTRCVRLG